MKKILFLTLLLSKILFASLQVDTTYSTMGEIVKRVGGELVDVHILSSSKHDPHFITPKPSLLAKLRHADLLIINGGGLEIGWLPPLIKNANNAKIQPGGSGFLDMSHFMRLIEKPTTISRGFGDIHAQGNPHYTLDPHNVAMMAQVIAKKLSSLDIENASLYEVNLQKFLEAWEKYLKNYDATMSQCTRLHVVEYHELFNYYLKRYNFVDFGTIEPLPGITPSSKHTLQLIQSIEKNGVTTILQDVYHEKKTAQFIAKKTDAKVAVLPHEVGAVSGSDTLEAFYDTIAQRLCQ